MEPKPKIAVSGILLSKSGKILLGKRDKDDSYGGLWCTPGGGVEYGEELDDALVREFLEEVVMLTKVVPGFVSIQEAIVPEKRHTVMILKEVMTVSGHGPSAGDGFSEVGWFTWLEIQALMGAGEITELSFFGIAEYVKYAQDWKNRYELLH